MLDKTYRPETVETRQYEAWEEASAFAADPTGNKPPYTIMMPPPNVTGSLHMGHALTFTLQDILIRFERMRGRDALWQPGTDHAGIATEIVVSNRLAERQISRHDLGREKFIDQVWEWKAESGGTITRQLRRLGASPDWARERSTMDAGLSAAVRRVFVTLYHEGLIYRDKRLVNWDPVMHTVISDLEVDNRETRGSLWHIRYPIEGEPGRHIVVATTRPETMLGDTGIAVHPDDPRHADLVGKTVRLPLVGRRIPIVADEYADPEKGSGAVKITPAHDFNDFEVGRRHGLEAINIFDRDAHLNDGVPEKYRGLERFAARKKVLADLEAEGLIEKIEDHVLMVPHHDRSGEIIEPWLTDQWFCNAAELARPAIEAVERGRTQFVPRQWENTFFEWMRNIQPWCISRQLWWGHQIPAWYGPDGAVFVAESEAEAHAFARDHYGREGEALTRDPDVLDTWFSSGLWPFSTLGWPDKTPELEHFYPTDVLVTGFDIIFFWVARMMMLGLHLMGEVPFRQVYIHGLVRDEAGAKMSKTKGNVVDPLEVIDSYGADALRYAILASTAQGRDIKFGPARIEGYRNFVTKLWNASRFLELNEARLDIGFEPSSCAHILNRWIVGETAKAAAAAGEAFRAYRFNDAALGLYQFVWGTFCDWYVELAKPLLTGEDEALRAETRAAAAWAMAQTLHLLHPMAPYVTEELWAELLGAPGGMLIAARWPEVPASLVDPRAEAELSWLTRTVAAIRSARAELNVPPSAKLHLQVHGANAATWGLLRDYRELVQRMAGLDGIVLYDTPVARQSLQVVVDEVTYHAAVGDVVDLAKERARLEKEIAKLDAEAGKTDERLANPSFVERAPADVVEQLRERREELRAARERLGAALARIA